MEWEEGGICQGPLVALTGQESESACAQNGCGCLMPAESAGANWKGLHPESQVDGPAGHWMGGG